MKILVGMICPKHSDEISPIFRDVADEEQEIMLMHWNGKLVKAFYEPVIKKLTEMEALK